MQNSVFNIKVENMRIILPSCVIFLFSKIVQNCVLGKKDRKSFLHHCCYTENIYFLIFILH